MKALSVRVTLLKFAIFLFLPHLLVTIQSHVKLNFLALHELHQKNFLLQIFWFSVQKWGEWSKKSGFQVVSLEKYDIRRNLSNIHFNVATSSHTPYTLTYEVNNKTIHLLPPGYMVKFLKSLLVSSFIWLIYS